jgi:thiamine pyrophosphate-dependent acetolactate synthase large subunit-like protein
MAVAVTGDGGFGQYAMELTTAVKYGMGTKHVLLNNALGKISKEQLAGEYPPSGRPTCAIQTGPATLSCAARPGSESTLATSSTTR